MLLTSDISRLTGYTLPTVQKWINEERLQGFRVRNKLASTKEWLIEFLCTEAYKIVMKSDKHIELMDKFHTRRNRK